VKPYNISVTLSLPPDTDTPGFVNEEKTKPMETRLISQSAGLVSPEVVAKQLMKDALVSYMLHNTVMGCFMKHHNIIVPDMYCVISTVVYCLIRG
jgi:3-dehydrosphinganine reductase